MCVFECFIIIIVISKRCACAKSFVNDLVSSIRLCTPYSPQHALARAHNTYYKHFYTYIHIYIYEYRYSDFYTRKKKLRYSAAAAATVVDDGDGRTRGRQVTSNPSPAIPQPPPVRTARSAVDNRHRLYNIIFSTKGSYGRKGAYDISCGSGKKKKNRVYVSFFILFSSRTYIYTYTYTATYYNMYAHTGACV